MRRLITSLTALVLLAFSASGQGRKKDYNLKSDDGIFFRYDEKRQLEVDLESFPRHYYLRVSSMYLAQQALTQFIEKSQWQQAGILFQSFRMFPCEKAEDRFLCRNYKQENLQLYNRTFLGKPENLVKAQNYFTYGRYNIGRNYYVQDYNWQAVFKFEGPTKVNIVHKKIFQGNFSRIYVYRFLNDQLQAQVYLEEIKKLHFKGVRDYAERWRQRFTAGNFMNLNAAQNTQCLTFSNQRISCLAGEFQKKKILVGLNKSRGFVMVFSGKQPVFDLL